MPDTPVPSEPLPDEKIDRYATEYADEADIVLIEPFDSNRRASFRRFVARVIEPILADLEQRTGGSFRHVSLNELVLKTADIRADTWRLLHHASLCIADVTGYDYRALSYLSLRLALSREPSIALFREGRRVAWPVHIEPILFNAEDDQDEELRRRIEDALFRPQGEREQRLGSPVFSELPSLSVNLRGEVRKAGRAPEFRDFIMVPVGRSPCLSIAVGDIRQLVGAEVWVNPENTAMEMARAFDGSISGTLRHLSSNWHDDGFRSDDFMRRQLARNTPERGVDPGTAIITRTSGQLLRNNGVKRVIHVAAVQARAGRGPGCGYESVSELQIGACVSNALDLVRQENRLRPKPYGRVVIPLMGSSTDPDRAERNVRAMVEAITRYFTNEPLASRIKAVALLAYTEEDARLIRRAFERSSVPIQPVLEGLGCWVG